MCVWTKAFTVPLNYSAMMLCSICENGRIFDLKPKVFLDYLMQYCFVKVQAPLKKQTLTHDQAEAELCTTHNFISTKAKTKSTGKLHWETLQREQQWWAIRASGGDPLRERERGRRWELDPAENWWVKLHFPKVGKKQCSGSLVNRWLLGPGGAYWFASGR